MTNRQIARLAIAALRMDGASPRATPSIGLMARIVSHVRQWEEPREEWHLSPADIDTLGTADTFVRKYGAMLSSIKVSGQGITVRDNELFGTVWGISHAAS